MNTLGNQTMFSKIKTHVSGQTTRIIAQNLDKKVYNVNDAQVWSNVICDEVLKSLIAVNKNFKYIANCIIMQKADCGLNISGSCYWDNDTDGTVTVKWDNQTLTCIVNVFGCCL